MQSAAQRRLQVLTDTICGSLNTTSSVVAKTTSSVAADNVSPQLDQHKVLFIELPAEEAVPREKIEEVFTANDLASVWALDGLPENIPNDIEAIVTVKKKVDKAVLDMCPKVKIVAVAFTGYDHVDVDECKNRGIRVANVPGYSTDGVAELAFGMIFSLLREIPLAYNHLRDGQWKWRPGRELKDKKFAVLGTGTIGLRVATVAKAFGVKQIIGFDKSHRHEFTDLGGIYAGSLATIFLDADIVVVNLQLTKETTGIVSRKLLKLLRPNSILINVARGPIIDQKAMAEMLCERRFKAGLDVYEIEPLPADDALRKVPAEQVVMVPHLAYKCQESLERRFDITLANILAYFADSPQNVVN